MVFFFFSSRRRHTRCALVTGVQTCALPIWYRFVVDGIRSDTGTVRTAPAAGAALDRLRIAVAGCQHYERGLFTAWRHISREADLDAVYHYGDYIYEGKPARAAAAAKAPIEIGRAHV